MQTISFSISETSTKTILRHSDKLNLQNYTELLEITPDEIKPI